MDVVKVATSPTGDTPKERRGGTSERRKGGKGERLRGGRGEEARGFRDIWLDVVKVAITDTAPTGEAPKEGIGAEDLRGVSQRAEVVRVAFRGLSLFDMFYCSCVLYNKSDVVEKQ